VFRRARPIVLGLLALTALGSGPEGTRGLKPGTLAPRFTLTTLDGKTEIDSRDLFEKATATVLILWDSYCPDCLATVKACQEFADRIEGAGLQVVGINYDHENLASVRGFLRVGKIRFPNLHDPTGKTIQAYRAQAYDFSYFVIDAKGIVRAAAYDHPPEMEKELLRAVNDGLGDASPLFKTNRGADEAEPSTD